MNELTRHIEILLLNSDCVVVPGLGAFITNYIDAQYDAEARTFCPPKRTVGFNCQLQNNDSTLASSYVEAYDISFPEAQRRVESDVEAIRQELATCGKYDFRGVGELRLTSDGRYDFMPCKAGLLTPALYAFYALAIEPVEQTDAGLEHRETEIPRIHVDVKQTAANEETYVANAGHVHLVDRELLRNALLAACMLLLFVFASLPLGRSTKSLEQSSFVRTEALMEFAKNHTSNIAKKLDATPVCGVENEPKAASLTDDLPKTFSEVKQVESDNAKAARYTIVLASRVSRGGAADFVASLKKAGYKDAFVLDRAGGVRKVVYGQYEDISIAKKSLEELRNKDERFADVWVAEL